MTIHQPIIPDGTTALRRPAAQSCLATVFNEPELAAIMLADVDDLRSLTPPGRILGLLSGLLFSQVNLALANPKLETLRRVAILLKAGPGAERADAVEAAQAAGYSAGQLLALQRHFDGRSMAHGPLNGT